MLFSILILWHEVAPLNETSSVQNQGQKMKTFQVVRGNILSVWSVQFTVILMLFWSIKIINRVVYEGSENSCLNCWLNKGKDKAVLGIRLGFGVFWFVWGFEGALVNGLIFLNEDFVILFLYWYMIPLLSLYFIFDCLVAVVK